MPNDLESLAAQAVSSISSMIACELRALSGEYWSPRLMPDQSESELKFRKERVERLRTMRDELEDVMHGLSPGVV
jgi:hypothetical protein